MSVSRRRSVSSGTDTIARRDRLGDLIRQYHSPASVYQSYLTSWTSTPPGCLRNDVYILAKSCRCGA
jgi:hypothetical protein